MGNKVSTFTRKQILRFSRFPLAKLPHDAIKNVLLIMDLKDLIAFSLCTNSTKQIVASLKLPWIKGSLFISDRIFVDIPWDERDFVIVRLEDETSKKWSHGDKKITKFGKIKFGDVKYGIVFGTHVVEVNKEACKWIKKNYDMRDWLEHFRALFGGKFEKITFFEECERYDLSLWDSTISKFSHSRVAVSEECDNAYIQEFYKNFKTLEKLRLDQNPYDRLVDYHRLVSRNFSELVLWFPVTVEELLVSKASTLVVKELSVKVINRFLKLWVKGGNRRLKELKIYFEERPEISKILNGIDHVRVKYDVFEIRRRNGMRGIVSVDWDDDGEWKVRFLVLNY